MCASSERKRLASIGTSVSETKAEATIASETITANSWNSRPITPGMKKIGMNTAMSELEIEMIVKPTSLEPCSAAWKGGMFFSSMKRKIFSSTMMASSITMPTMRVSASMVIWLSVKPIAAIKANVEMIDVGIAMAAISVVRTLARNRPIRRTTVAMRRRTPASRPTEAIGSGNVAASLRSTMVSNP